MSLMVSALLVLAPSLAAPRADVTFATAPAQVGQKTSVTSVNEMKMSMAMKMGANPLPKMEMPTKEDVSCTVTVTAVDDKGPTAAKLVFGKSTKMEPSPFGAAVEGDHSCSEKSYDVKRTDAGFVADPEAPQNEQETIGWLCDQALRTPLATLLGGKTLKDGESIDVPAEDAHRVIALLASDLAVKEMKLTLTGQQSVNGVDAALFKVTAKMLKSPDGEDPTTVAVDVTGEIAVAKNSLLILSSTLAGPVKIDGSMDQGGQMLTMEGRGTVNAKYSAKRE